MDIQADINWIVAKLRGVKNPHLIRAMKNMLEYRESRDQGVSVGEYDQEVKAAEQRVARGEYVTHEDMLKALDKW